MEDKTFEFLEKILTEVQDTKNLVSNLDTKVSNLDTKVSKIELTIENELKPDIKLALQGFIDTNEKLSVIEDKIDIISEKVDRHDIKIQVIEGGKKAKG